MPDAIAVVLFLAPGFLALKLFYLFGAQRPRSQWEWTTWSILASVPLSGLASLLRPIIPVPGARDDGLAVGLALLFGVFTGLVGAGMWRSVRSSSSRAAIRLRREVTDSAWDQALEDATNNRRAIRVLLDNDDSYRGTLMYGGREDAGASGWFYVSMPDRKQKDEDAFARMQGVHGVLVDRAHVKVLSVYQTSRENAAEKARTAAQPPAVPSSGVPEGQAAAAGNPSA